MLRSKTALMLALIALSAGAASAETMTIGVRAHAVVAGGSVSLDPEDRSKWAVPDEVEAISLACEIGGFPQEIVSGCTAEVVVLWDDNTPYLVTDVVGRWVWHVVTPAWKLPALGERDQAEDEYERTFDVYLDASDGKLLKLVSRWPEGVPSIPPEPPFESGTRQLLNSREIYLRFPEEGPWISFIEILAALEKGGNNPRGAEQIVGQYVMWSHLGKDPKPMWVITLRSTPLSEAAYPGLPVHAWAHMRYVVDPENVEWICGTNSPGSESGPLPHPSAARYPHPTTREDVELLRTEP